MTDHVDDGGVSTELLGSLGEQASDGTQFFSDASRVVTARGTEDGLILRIDGRAKWSEVLVDLEAFLGSRRKFFEGGELSVEWLERLPTKEQSKQLEALLKDHYGISIITRRKRPSKSSGTGEQIVNDQQKSGSGVTVPLFEEGSSAAHHQAAGPHPLASQIETSKVPERQELRSASAIAARSENKSVTQKYVHRVARLLGEEIYYDDEANAKIVYGTLRSGQRVETPFSLIVIGDVNPGADLTAGGDIIVLGSLRGTAHAGAYDDESFDNVIIALQMQPMQLRIGSVISRGSDELVNGAEIARIEKRRIIVEQFNPRAVVAHPRIGKF